MKAWANQRTKFELKARYPKGTLGPLPTLLEFAPRTAISGKSETYTVGADLTASSASVSGSYSVTTTQDSVDTSANTTLGEGLLRWNDTYHGFPSDNPPSTSTQTFTGERLAIFTVSRTINDNVPAGNLREVDEPKSIGIRSALQPMQWSRPAVVVAQPSRTALQLGPQDV